MPDTICLSGQTIEGITLALVQDFYPHKQPERMAWIVMLLKHVQARPEFFPGGKWATIHAIQHQLDNVALEAAKTIGSTYP